MIAVRAGITPINHAYAKDAAKRIQSWRAGRRRGRRCCGRKVLPSLRGEREVGSLPRHASAMSADPPPREAGERPKSRPERYRDRRSFKRRRHLAKRITSLGASKKHASMRAETKSRHAHKVSRPLFRNAMKVHHEQRGIVQYFRMRGWAALPIALAIAAFLLSRSGERYRTALSHEGMEYCGLLAPGIIIPGVASARRVAIIRIRTSKHHH